MTNSENYVAPIEKCDTAEMMVELKKRGYVVIPAADYKTLIDAELRGHENGH